MSEEVLSQKKSQKDTVFGPDPVQKKYWFLIWLIIFLPLAGAGALITVFTILGGAVFLIPSMAVMFFSLYWYHLYHQSLHYAIADEHVVVEKGVWWQRKTTVPFEKITNVDRTQNPFERIYAIGKVHVQTAGAGGSQGAKAEVIIRGVKDLSGIQDNIERRIRGKMVKKELSTSKEKDIFERILTEIKAIRQELKK